MTGCRNTGARLRGSYEKTCDSTRMRTAYRCRAYPRAEQQAVLSRTFGCVRVVRNRTLAQRQARWHVERRGTSYAETDRALTTMKKDPQLAFLNEVSCVPLQQALRHQHKAFTCQQGSANRAKAKAKVARAHRKVRDARKDFLHRASTRMVRENDMIVIEDLAVKNMVRNRHLARVISECGWGEFRRQLAYKCQRYGRALVVIGRFYPSSKTCSACGHLLAELSLNTRTWQCPSCGIRHDRDINAAKNILAAGQAVTACGAGVRHSGSSRVRPAVNQEPRPVTAGIPVLQGGE
jgi:IS605 OrfB family transposase